MTTQITGVNNHTAGTRNTIEDFMTSFRRRFRHEGIIDGLSVEETDPVSDAVTVNPGTCVIDCGSSGLMPFRIKSAQEVTLPNIGTSKYYLIVLKVDITNATNTLVAVEGTLNTDPTLTEGGTPDIYYLEIARIAKTATTTVTDAQIIQDGTTVTNNGDGNIIHRNATENSWYYTDEEWAYASATTITTKGNKVKKYTDGLQLKFTQSQAYTNDPTSGSSVALNMTDTSGFRIGNEVRVSSSAGVEYAVIESIVANTSITVDALSIDHTDTDPLVTLEKYFVVRESSFANPDTTITVESDSYGLANATITNRHYSNGFDPEGFQTIPTEHETFLHQGYDYIYNYGI